ncbi:arginine-tRNA-protein transferase [Arboricoccus pini]|uniref:Aspartate/glutamate leucyltransferase n=1 Tax=Arboricoccus pini TaxID=1963835 RepID=A0A212QNU8_9PROT|nr:arginyltransferase [Arboricoccus pini]SNB60914.1 arginine-tRNA-protein transferase [Arboricoccus pini]
MTITTPRRFYTTELAPCPYLDGLKEQRVLTTLRGEDSEAALSAFTEIGFRRSQTYLYRPACPSCRRCVPVRIVADRFEPSRRFRKVLRRNADLSWAVLPSVASEEQFELFHRYLAARHPDGSMMSMEWADYRAMLEDSPACTMIIEFRYADGRLAGVSLTDQLRNGLSGVYKFFDPIQSARSLGTFIILWHVQEAVRRKLPYVYLGYWVEGSKTMDYKADFQPAERLGIRGWQLFEPSSTGG